MIALVPARYHPPAMLLLQVLISMLLFVGVFLPIWAVFRYPARAGAPVHRRLARAVGTDRDTVFEQPVLGPVMNLGLTLSRRMGWPGLRARVKQDLDASGNPSGYSVEEYLSICVVGCLAASVGAVVLEAALGTGMLLLLLPVAAAAGFWMPLMALRGRAKARTARVARQVPYTLDLISLVMAAGSSFTEAVATLIRDHPEDDLNQELAVALSEMELGATRTKALQGVAERVPLESLRSVVAAVNQAESLGTPLSGILKLQADMLRMQRSVRAEKLSASASLRILVPSMLILLAVVLIVFAPFLILIWQKGTLF